MQTLLAILVILALASPAHASEVYQAPAAFVDEAFAGEEPIARAIWVTGDLKQRVKNVLGHAYRHQPLYSHYIASLRIGANPPILLRTLSGAGVSSRPTTPPARPSTWWVLRTRPTMLTLFINFQENHYYSTR